MLFNGFEMIYSSTFLLPVQQATFTQSQGGKFEVQYRPQ